MVYLSVSFGWGINYAIRPRSLIQRWNAMPGNGGADDFSGVFGELTSTALGAMFRQERAALYA